MNLVDKFKNEDIVINCNTEEQTAALFNWCEENGIIVTEQTKDYSFWECKETVCYRCGADSQYQLYYADIDFYTKEGYTIIRYLDFFEKNTNTIKIKDIVEKYAEYEIDEDKLKELLIKPKQKTIWELEVGDTYNYINSDGTIVTSIWGNDFYHVDRRAAGNCFLTQKEAGFELERRKVETELLRCGGTRDMMSIGEVCTRKYYIIYSHFQDKVCIESLCCTQYLGCIYFKSREDAQRAIDEIGEDRIKKYLFYVD